MVMATANTITHPNCDALETAGVITANVKGATVTDAVGVMARAYDRGSCPIGRAIVTHEGFQRNASVFDASTALYRVTLGRY
jgi:hypothetical protein